MNDWLEGLEVHLIHFLLGVKEPKKAQVSTYIEHHLLLKQTFLFSSIFGESPEFRSTLNSPFAIIIITQHPHHYIIYNVVFFISTTRLTPIYSSFSTLR